MARSTINVTTSIVTANHHFTIKGASAPLIVQAGSKRSIAWRNAWGIVTGWLL